MATGDKQAQSYGWGKKLTESVPIGSSTDIPAPGFDTQYTDTRYAEISVISTSIVYLPDKIEVGQPTIDIDFNVDDEPVTITLTNETDKEWEIGEGLYVFCPHLLSEGNNEWDVKGQIWDLQQRVTALEEAAE